MAQAQSARAINLRGSHNDILPLDLKLIVPGILSRKYNDEIFRALP